MRKGQKVRLLADNTVGTIADSTFFKLNGKKQVQYLVVTPKNRKGCWYPVEKLGSVMEAVKVTVKSESGKEMIADIIRDHDKGKLDITITGNPENLKEHKGTHVQIMSCLLESLSKDS